MRIVCLRCILEGWHFSNNLDKHARDKVLHACAVFRPLFLCGMCFVLQSRRKDKTFVDNLRKHGRDQVVHVFRPLIGCGMCCPTLPSSCGLLIMRPKAGETHFGREGNQLDLKISTFYTFRKGMELRIVSLSIYSICCDIQRWKIIWCSWILSNPILVNPHKISVHVAWYFHPIDQDEILLKY